MNRTLAIYCLSGFISLAYQVAWFRILSDWFGSTTLTFALVVCNFIGGLGLGALLSKRLASIVAERFAIPDRIRLYGLIEMAVAASALLTIALDSAPKDFLGSFPYVLAADGIWIQTASYQALQISVATICVFVPCFFMGMTYPLLCEAYLATPKGDRFPSLLYAWNTFGACAGVLVCQFLLVPQVGHGATFRWMLALNLLLGLYCLATGGDPGVGSDRADSGKGMAGPTGWAGPMLVLASLSGFVAGGLEGDLFKRMGFLISTNPGASMPFISFWAVLSIFLGSLVVNRLPGLKLNHIKGLFAAGIVCYSLTWHFRDELMLALGPEISQAGRFTFPGSMMQLFAYIGIFTFPAFFCFSTLLPYVCNRLQGRGQHLGLAYGLNTLAFCGGVVAFTLIAPLGNIFFSLKLFLIILALLALFLFSLSDNRKLRFWQPATLVVAAIAAVTLTPDAFDRSYFFAGSKPNRLSVRSVQANAAHTIFVTSDPSGVGRASDATLFFGRLSMSGTNVRAQTYMRLMAHFPLLAQAQPTKSLLICFGVGNTASAIAAHASIQAIDVVELNANVLGAAPEFADYNNGVHLDPRVRLIHDDGRNFLAVSDEKYDLITSEPPPPLGAGTYRLYSREYYEQVSSHLSDEGMMTQWLPIYQMPAEASRMIVSTFLRVFPEALLFRGFADDLILLGSKNPIDLEGMNDRMSHERLAAKDLRSLGITSAADLRRRVLLDDEQLRVRFGEVPVISDQRNDLDHMFIDRSGPAPTL